ncbi:MAG: GtrA family protein [Pseudomonadales bacterium]
MNLIVRKIVEDFLTLQFIKFFFSALAAAAVNFLVRLVLDPYVGYSYAIVIAYVVGTIFAFFLYQRKVFGDGIRPLWQETFLYVFVTLAAMAQTLIISIVLADHFFPAINLLWYPKELAHVIGMGVPMFSSFLGHKYLTFSQHTIPD